MNTCINCTHMHIQALGIIVPEQLSASQMECRHPRAATRDVVTGRCMCQAERSAGRKGCGPSGRLWEEKK